MLVIALVQFASASAKVIDNRQDNRCFIIKETIGTFRTPVDRNSLAYDGAVECLAKLLREDYPDYDLEQKLLLTGAIRTSLVDGGATAIRRFRLYDDAELLRRLADDAIGDDASLRINASIVLASVVDNSTICVPIDALYSLIGKSDQTSDNGRFNLVGVIGTVAPWSYRENYDEIQRVLEKVTVDLNSRSNTDKTRALIRRIIDRPSGTSRGTDNRNAPAPAGLDSCKTYDFKFRQ